jgi:hypothetical protein
MDECPENECRFPPWKECKTATDWSYNYMCNDEDYFLDAKCDEGLLRLKCKNQLGTETNNNFKYYNPDAKVEMKREVGRKNKEELEKSLRGTLKPKKSKKRNSKKSKRNRKKKKQTKRKKKQTKRKKR